MKYEMLYLIDASVADEPRDALIGKFESIVKELGGTVLSTDKWGVKKLAYEIDFKSEGYYVLMNFTAPSEFPQELERQMRITDEVIRFIVVKK